MIDIPGERPSRPVAASQHVSSELIMPPDANILGHAFGGAIMAMVDKAAAVFRHARSACVTASMDIGVRVKAEELISGARHHTNTCYLTFVAIDRNGRPVPIAMVLPERDDQRRRDDAAQARRRRRLEEWQGEARTPR